MNRAKAVATTTTTTKVEKGEGVVLLLQERAGPCVSDKFETSPASGLFSSSGGGGGREGGGTGRRERKKASGTIHSPESASFIPLYSCSLSLSISLSLYFSTRLFLLFFFSFLSFLLSLGGLFAFVFNADASIENVSAYRPVPRFVCIQCEPGDRPGIVIDEETFDTLEISIGRSQPTIESDSESWPRRSFIGYHVIWWTLVMFASCIVSPSCCWSTYPQSPTTATR